MSKMAILTSFKAFVAGYSLTQICIDKAKMLTMYGHDVTIFVSEDYSGEDIPGVHLSKTIPATAQIDYQSREDLTDEHRIYVKDLTQYLVDTLAGYDFAMSEDWIFTGWHCCYALAIMEASKSLPDLRWMHWIHSVPTGSRDWWRIREYGQNHKIVYPNQTDSLRVAECYRGTTEDVLVIPHIRDLRSIWDFSQETCDFIREHKKFMQADILQVYPCSSDRLSAKRLDIVINIFGKLKEIGYTVCLVAANQWATGKKRREDLYEYLSMAQAAGLLPGIEFIFTSLWRDPQYEAGISKIFLRELTLCSNLFIFPTREESFGLVLPEAALSGALCILNTSLAQQMEIAGHNARGFLFGSFDQTFTPEDYDKYLRDVAWIISERLRKDDTIRLKTWCRQRYNMDYLYRRYYGPTMAAAKEW